MITYKKRAISLAPYTLKEYTDYVDMLRVGINLYNKSGDKKSVEACKSEAISVPQKIADVLGKTDSLAWKIQDLPQLELPSEYTDYIDSIKQ